MEKAPHGKEEPTNDHGSELGPSAPSWVQMTAASANSLTATPYISELIHRNCKMNICWF